MAEVSIDIDAMDSLVSDLEAVRDTIPSDVGSIRSRLEYVWLSTDSVSSVGTGGAIWGWIDGAIMDCHRRLALARLINDSSPGGGMSVVTFDDDVLSTLSESEVAELVEELEGLITTDDWSDDRTDIDPRVLEILNDNAHDPYFAQMLAQAISPQELDAYLDRVVTHREFEERTPDDKRAFDEGYDELLNGFGLAFGMASTNTGDTAVPGLTDQWTSYLEEASPRDGAHLRLSMVIGRGTWSSDFLVDVFDTFKEIEGDSGPEAFFYGPPVTILVEPDSATDTGVRIVDDPMVGLLRAMETNPEAVRQVFGSGATTNVEFDGENYGDVNSELYHFLRHRGSGEDAIEALMGALGSAMMAPPVEGATAWQASLGEDIGAIVDSIEAEVAYAEENRPPWWSRWGHGVLDLLGMIPVIGEAADGINGLWYLAEGDHVNAAISGASMLPIGGWFVQGGKWVKRAFTPDELATLGRLADSGDIARYLPGGRLVNSAADMADPSNFRVQSFLSANDLRRFSGNREWLQPLVAGRRFDDYMAPNYPHNQVRLDYGNGKYVILDSYVPGEAIISRKLTQLSAVEPTTAMRYVDELADKYPPGARIQGTPENVAAGIDGQALNGDMVLQVPPQANAIPDDVLQHAFENNIRIIDINGVDYTAHLFN